MTSSAHLSIRTILATSVAVVASSAALAQAPATPPGFDANYYVNRYPDLKRVIGNNPQGLLDHWNKHGRNELRTPSAEGDPIAVGYARWKAGCEADKWGGKSIEKKLRKGGGHTLITHLHCDEQVYKYSVANAKMLEPPRSGHLRSYMRTNDWLKSGEYMVSGGKTHIAALQSDGNFCVYQGSSPATIHGSNKWCSMKAPGQGQYFAIQQADGNFCVYKGTGPADNRGGVYCVLRSPVQTASGLFFAAIQDDANFAIYHGVDGQTNWGWAWDRITTKPAAADSVWESMYKGGIAVGNAMAEFEKMKNGGK